MSEHTVTAFAGAAVVATGLSADVTTAVRTLHEQDDERTVLVFDDVTGEQVDLDLRVTAAPVEPERRGPGRPKLGVVAREVTLLPRHWEWLAAQPGGASVALRKLVEQARRDNERGDRVRRSREATYRFMTAMAGNEPGYEEACRALFAGDRERFAARVDAWPADIASYANRLAGEAFPDTEAA